MPVNDDYDAISDELIEIIINNASSDAEKARASKDLFERHNDWVNKQISGSVFDPDDRRDVAQVVWMMVLPADKLRDSYTKKGKFRAYLRAPIRWAILKHIDKLPFRLDEAGNKQAVMAVDVSENMLESGLDQSILENVIEKIIKPSLSEVDIRSRNVYLLNEYNVLFYSHPTLDEAASINAISQTEAAELFDSASNKPTNTCSDEELSVYIPVEYNSLIEPDQLKKSSGRYLAQLIGVTEAVFRKRLHTARKFLLETVRVNLPSLSGDYNNG